MESLAKARRCNLGARSRGAIVMTAHPVVYNVWRRAVPLTANGRWQPRRVDTSQNCYKAVGQHPDVTLGCRTAASTRCPIIEDYRCGDDLSRPGRRDF